MTAEYVRSRYHVPAKRGMRVRVQGREGTITRLTHYIWVRFDGAKHSDPCHPTWEVEYMEQLTQTHRGRKA